MIEEKDANEEQESSTVQDEGVESSTTEDTQPEEATSQEAVEKEPPFNQHPRFKEILDEKNELKRQVSDLQNKLVGITERVTTPQSSENPYDGMTVEEVQFYKNLDARTQKQIDKAVSKAKEDAERGYQSEIQGYQKMVGNVIAKDFLKSHPDVKKGSEEMRLITEKARDEASRGKDLTEALDDAYKVVMFDRNAQTAAERERKKQKQTIEAKQAANVETTSVSESSPIIKKYEDFDKSFDSTAKELGISI